MLQHLMHETSCDVILENSETKPSPSLFINDEHVYRKLCKECLLAVQVLHRVKRMADTLGGHPEHSASPH